MTIVNMNTLTKEHLSQAAQILTDSLPLGWATFNDATDEINQRLIPENTLLAALEDNVVVGFGDILPNEF